MNLNLSLKRILTISITISIPVFAAAYLYQNQQHAMKLGAIKAANVAFAAKKVSGPVGVFVGGTSGLGEAAMKKFTALTVAPKIYFVGRNADAGSRITKELHVLNAGAQVEFIQTDDLSLLANSATVANAIAAKESKLNLLVVSQGYMSMAGHTPTSEGIERKIAINVYSRLLFVRTLLPLLRSASSTDAGARVMSIYAPGEEGPVDESDFPMATGKNFSLARVAQQGVAMNSLALEHLADVEKEVGWLHTYPGAVMTGYMRDLPWWGKAVMPVMGAVAANSADDVGEGLGMLCTGETWGRGLHLVDWKGESRDMRGKTPVFFSRLGGNKGNWWREGLGKIVWEKVGEKTEEVLKAAGQK